MNIQWAIRGDEEPDLGVHPSGRAYIGWPTPIQYLAWTDTTTHEYEIMLEEIYWVRQRAVREGAIVVPPAIWAYSRYTPGLGRRHDGRHRAVLAAEEGIQRIPVFFLDTDDPHHEDPIWEDVHEGLPNAAS